MQVCVFTQDVHMCMVCAHTRVCVSTLVSHVCMCEISVRMCMVCVPGLSLESLTDLCSVRGRGGLCSAALSEIKEVESRLSLAVLVRGLQAPALGTGTLPRRETWPRRVGERRLKLGEWGAQGWLCVPPACPEAVGCRLVSGVRPGPWW